MTIKIDCGEIVWYNLPLIRKDFAKGLITDHGLIQRKATEKLGIAETTVSQYILKKRGDLKVIKCKNTARNQRINKTNNEW